LQRSKVRLLSARRAAFDDGGMTRGQAGGGAGSEPRGDQQPGWPEPRRAWFAVAALMAAYAVSFVDRQILNLLTEELKRDLAVSDLQIGMLQGLAFGVFYTLVGLPIGRLGDSLNRRNVILAGAFLWSLMTISCGLARSFGQLFAARIGVGVGEAALSPAAMSMISDYFPPERRALPMSLYVTGTSLGSGIALIVGGFVITRMTALGSLELPLVGVVAPWQAAFIAVGLPSLLLVPLLLSVAEPPRRGLLAASGAAGSRLGLRDGLRYVTERRAVYLSHNLGLAAVSVFTYGLSVWAPALFIRRFGWTPGEIGGSYGALTVICGAIGVLGGGWLAQRLRRAGHEDANWRVLTFCVIALVPLGIVTPLLPDARWVLIAYAPTTILTTLPFGIGAAALQEITPNELRAQVAAVYLLALGLVGLGLGPTGVGFLTDRVFGDPQAIGSAMSLMTAIWGPIAVGALLFGWRPFRRLLATPAWSR
jgi:MFS family permease